MLRGVAGAQSALAGLNSPTHAADVVFGLYRNFLDGDPDAGDPDAGDRSPGDGTDEFYDRVTR
jgi:hypothetical protein